LVGSDSDQSLVPVLARIPSRCKAQALVHLSSAADPDAWAELLPYLLDPHGPGSRLSVMLSTDIRNWTLFDIENWTPGLCDVAPRLSRSGLSR
jgi:hypothetical protein